MIPKFRAWDTFKKKWVKHFYLTENGLIYNMEQQHRDLIGAVPIEKSGLIVMQSTGLKDKNGVEIFEGDVVAYFDGDEQISENIIIRYGEHTNIDTVLTDEPKHIGFYIEVTKGTATFDVTDMYEEYKENIKVIGNIHDNPELVEVG